MAIRSTPRARARVGWTRRLATRLVATLVATGALTAAASGGAVMLASGRPGAAATAAVALGGLVVGAVGALAVGSRQGQRMDALVAGLTTLRSRGSATPVDDRGRDELALAAHAFNVLVEEQEQIARQLRRRTEELARVSAHRTETLRRHSLAMQVGRLDVWEWHIESGTIDWSAHVDTVDGAAARPLPDTYDGLVELVDPDHRHTVMDTLAESVRIGTTFEVEFPITAAAAGRQRWLRTVGSVVADAQGFAERVIGVAIDITAERHAAEGLRRRAAREHALAELGRLALEDLTPSALLADVTSVLGEELTAEAIAAPTHRAPDPGAERAGALPDAADEDRAFVEAAITLVASALDRCTTEEQRRRAERAAVVQGLSTGIAHDLRALQVSRHENLERLLDRLEACGAEPEVADVDVAALVSGLQPRVRGLLGEGVVLAVHCPTAATVRADLSGLEQAVVQLCRNGRDAMPDGGELTLAVEETVLDLGEAGIRGLRPGAYVRIAVTDTGPGMDERTRAHAHEPFFTTKSREAGTGLGLTLVHRVATRAEGTLALRSAPGRGATAELLLPCARPREELAAGDLSELVSPVPSRGVHRAAARPPAAPAPRSSGRRTA